MKSKIVLLTTSAVLLAACSDDETTETTAQFTVSVSNLTANQPMSPLAVLTHASDYSLFTLGEAASEPLEYLAEGGSNSELIALMNSNSAIEQGYSGNGLLLPGSTDEITITTDYQTYGQLSVASMLVNTNDGFIGETNIDLSQLSIGESYEMVMNVWDSGTELNDELAATIPGPAGGGEGFNATRDDSSDIVTFHPGVVTQDDGLTTSALSANHRFLNPGAKLLITRTQ